MQKSPLSHHHNSSTNTPHTMSSSATPPQVEPPTTIKTKSSFSEIEQIVDPQHTPKNHSYVTSQLQTEPFVSPLTETNLTYHKSSFPPSRETKHRYVDSFIQNQKILLEQELELQRKTKTEIQSMIPLDTKSIDEELVRDDQQQHHQQLWNGFLLPLAPSPHNTMPPTVSLGTARRRHSIQGEHRFSNNHDNQDLSELDAAENERQPTQQVNDGTKQHQNSSSKKPWMKTLARWIRLGQLTKPDEHDDKDDQQRQQPETAVTSDTSQNENENLDLHADPSPSLPTIDDSHGPYRKQPRKAARHVSWSGGTSFEYYKQQKANMIEEGLYGLSNANIARALGSSQQGSRAPFLFLPAKDATTTSSSYTTSMHAPTPTPTPDLHDPADSHTSSTSSTHQKKELNNISFVQQTLSSAKSLLRPRKSLRKKPNHVDPQEPPQMDNSNNGDDEYCDTGMPVDSPADPTQQHLQQQKLEKERRRRSMHVSGRYSPSLSALKEEELAGTTGQCQDLVAFRYPKMVRIKDLRDAAIQILSTTDTGGTNANDNIDYTTMLGYNSDGRASWLAQDKAKWKMEPNDIDGGDGEHDDDDDVANCAKRYRNSIKRFSDPGTGSLPTPPFSIGRPISSLYY